jgi:hypothetical protein
LIEDEASRPDRGRASEPGQNAPGHERLYRKQQERANEDCRCE